MDTSDYISSSVLSQYDSSNILHPMVYFPNKDSHIVYNYEIYEKS
jgi:hypothetical protein